MKLIETTIRDETVRMLYANAQTKDEATEWVELTVKVPGDDNRRLGAIQQEALRKLRELVISENERVESLPNMIRR